MSPVGVFSNLLNAYATMDSKHDLTEKLINGATSLFNGGGEEEVKEEGDTKDDGEVTDINPRIDQVSIINLFCFCTCAGYELFLFLIPHTHRIYNTYIAVLAVLFSDAKF